MKRTTQDGRERRRSPLRRSAGGGERTGPARLALWLAATLAACQSTGPWHDDEARRHVPGAGPRILCVVAHPDDEIAFAGVLYKTATHLGGHCDVAVITNGEGGFKYSTLAERVYGLELTREEVGRAHLPAIRRAELRAGCDVLGVSHVYFLDQTDHRYTQDPLEVLAPDAGVWDLPSVHATLVELLQRGAYDFLLVLAPTAETHGHHKAASILALRAARTLSPAARPVLLCARTGSGEEPAPPFVELDGFPETALAAGPALSFDRTQRFGYRERLDYRIVVNWAIAEHRSQGTMQLLVNRGELEHYALFEDNARDAVARARDLFTRLAEPQFETRVYGPGAGAVPAGTNGR